MGLFNFRKQKQPTNNKTPIERYLEHLDSIFQKEPEFFKNDSLISGVPGVSSIVYRDIPEKVV